MKKRWDIGLLVWGLLLWCGAVQVALAAETAYMVRATALKAKPFADAETVATLEEQSKVEVLARQASWMQVKAAAGTGWVKMLSVRLGKPGAQPANGGDSGLGKLFNLATTGSSGSTVTTGVRGLSEEQLKNAQPDPEGFKALQGYAAKKEEAQKFAKAGQLQTEKLDYLDASKAEPSATSEAGEK
jgi:hypothetical protein